MSEKLFGQIFRKIYGKPSWNVQKGYGSAITFEFGKPKLEVLKKVFRPSKDSKRKYPRRLAYVHGEWHLWIYCCDWKLCQDGQKISDSKSSEKKIEQGCGIINGQMLTSAIVDPWSKRTDFHFDLGAHLQTSSYKGARMTYKGGTGPYEMWTLYCPNQFVYAFRDDGNYHYQRGDTPHDEVRWLPFTP